MGVQRIDVLKATLPSSSQVCDMCNRYRSDTCRAYGHYLADSWGRLQGEIELENQSEASWRGAQVCETGAVKPLEDEYFGSAHARAESNSGEHHVGIVEEH